MRLDSFQERYRDRLNHGQILSATGAGLHKRRALKYINIHQSSKFLNVEKINSKL